MAIDHTSCVQEDFADSTRIYNNDFACYVGYCGDSDRGWCKDLEKEDPMFNSSTEETPASFLSHCITSSEPTYASFYCILSLIPHCLRLLNPGKLSLSHVSKWRTLEARYQEERETCKQSI